MADFYPLLSRAVSKLPIDGPHERQELYDKARAILLGQLHGTATAPSLIRQQASLEAAIRRIEAEIRVEIVRRGPLSRAINLTADDNFTDQNDGRRPVSEPFPTTSSKRPLEDQSPTSPRRDFESRFDIGISLHDREAHEPEAKTRSPIRNSPYVGASAAYEAPPIGYEESRTLPNGRDEKKTALRTEAKFDIGADFSRPISVREGLRDSLKSSETQSIKPSQPLLGRLSVIIALTAGMALIVILSAIVVFPFLVLHAGRLVWLSQHLFDNPAVLRSLFVILAMFLLVSFPLFHLGRKKLRRTLARR